MLLRISLVFVERYFDGYNLSHGTVHHGSKGGVEYVDAAYKSRELAVRSSGVSAPGRADTAAPARGKRCRHSVFGGDYCWYGS